MIKLASSLIMGFALTVGAIPARANSTIFAGYTQTNNGQDFVLTSTSLGAGNYSVTIMNSGEISFNYFVGGTPFGPSSQLATLNLTATSTFIGDCDSSDANCTTDGSSYTQTGYSGSFSITAVLPFMGLTNLLSGTFNQSQFSSSVGADAGNLHAIATSSNPNQITFTSDFLKFTDSVTRDATFSVASLTPIFAVLGNTGNHNGYPRGFTGMVPACLLT